MSADPKLEIRRRRLPHWRLEGSCYFVTFRTETRALNHDEIRMVRDHIASGDPDFYELFAVVVMPDHVHVLLEPRSGFSLERILKGLKGVSARFLNQRRRSRGTIWQEEYFDRIVRDEQELQEKMEYMLENPVKAGLCKDPWRYPGWLIGRRD